MLATFIQYLVFFLTLGVPDQEARALAAEATVDHAGAVCSVLAVGDPDAADDFWQRADDPLYKAGCTPVPNSFQCRGTMCAIKCSSRECCTRAWDSIAKKWRTVCIIEIDPSTCVSQPLVPPWVQ